jgi:hypothetical protein
MEITVAMPIFIAGNGHKKKALFLVIVQNEELA